MSNIPEHLVHPFTELVLSIADDKLMLGHRNSDWTGLAPILEEDIAFSSLSQDNVAHAMALYEMAGELLGASADRLAFGREPEQYRCASIVEVPDEFNWATAMTREFFCTHCDELRFTRLSRSNHKPIADLAARLLAEQRVQTEHVDGWIERLGTGNDDSNTRMQQAIDALAPHAPMLFETMDREDELVESGLYPLLEDGPSNLFDAWKERLVDRTTRANLRLALELPAPEARGGRRGAHTEAFIDLLNEMCEVYRLEPDAAW